MVDPLDELSPKESPRVWIAAGIFLAAITLAFIMLVYTSVTAHAQALCAPASQILPAWKENLKEVPIWEGVMPQDSGAIEFVLTQSPSGSWSLFTIQNGIACLSGAGRDGNPNDLGKGV